MKRTIAGIAIAVAAVLGVSACGGGSETPAETGAAATEEAATTEQEADEEEAEPAGEQSVADACLAVATPLADASVSMAESSTKLSEMAAEMAADPVGSVENLKTVGGELATMWQTLGDAFATASESITNADVKAATGSVAESVSEYADMIKEVYVDGDFSAVTEVDSISTNLQLAFDELNTVCEQ